MQVWLPRLWWLIVVVLVLVWSVALPVVGLIAIARWWG